MVEEAYKNADDMPISDILTEIRLLVSAETSARYSRDRELAVTELLILRPEARVDLVLQEPEIIKKPAKKISKLANPLGVSSNEELRSLIREIFHEEFENWSNS